MYPRTTRTGEEHTTFYDPRELPAPAEGRFITVFLLKNTEKNIGAIVFGFFASGSGDNYVLSCLGAIALLVGAFLARHVFWACFF